MAKMGDIKIIVDDFLTETRLYTCFADCYKNINGECQYKKIKISKTGQCEQYEEHKR